ncbi:hypothetical protein LA080_011522 [Diaporthe eres]|nr:hypothetical protein LA080_011522 [Diaporthe eres]
MEQKMPPLGTWLIRHMHVTPEISVVAPISASGPAFLRVVLDSDENTAPPAAVAAWAISMSGLYSRQMAFQSRAVRQCRRGQLGHAGAIQCLVDFRRNYFKYDLTRSLDPGAGIIVEAILSSSTTAAALVWGNFAEEWALVGSTAEALADFDLNACSGHERTARMASLDGGPRLDSARLFCQTFVRENTTSCVGSATQKTGKVNRGQRMRRTLGL